MMSPVITTLASVLLSPTAEVGTHSHWQTLIKAARHYSHIFPSANGFLATLLGLPQMSSIPSLASFKKELALVEQTAREASKAAEAPHLEMEAHQVASGVSLPADLGTGFEGLEAAQLRSVRPSAGTAGFELLARLGAGSMEVSDFDQLGGAGGDPMPLLGSGMNDFAADFADW